MSEKTYYISGPMTGFEHFNYPRFEVAAKLLRKYGLTVVSPHELVSEMTHKNDLSYEEMLRIDLAAMMKCDVVVQLSGWKESPGCLREALCASWTGIEIVAWNELIGKILNGSC